MGVRTKIHMRNISLSRKHVIFKRASEICWQIYRSIHYNNTTNMYQNIEYNYIHIEPLKYCGNIQCFVMCVTLPTRIYRRVDTPSSMFDIITIQYTNGF